jgi:hypothetical protein
MKQKPDINCEMAKQYTIQPTQAYPLELSTHRKQNLNLIVNLFNHNLTIEAYMKEISRWNVHEMKEEICYIPLPLHKWISTTAAICSI